MSLCESESASLTLQGLKQHIEASHDLFDFSYPKAEPGGVPTEGVSAGGVPTITVGCPDDLFDQHGNLQTLETDDLESVDGKVQACCLLQVPFRLGKLLSASAFQLGQAAFWRPFWSGGFSNAASFVQWFCLSLLKMYGLCAYMLRCSFCWYPLIVVSGYTLSAIRQGPHSQISRDSCHGMMQQQ